MRTVTAVRGASAGQVLHALPSVQARQVREVHFCDTEKTGHSLPPADGMTRREPQCST